MEGRSFVARRSKMWGGPQRFFLAAWRSHTFIPARARQIGVWFFTHKARTWCDTRTRAHRQQTRMMIWMLPVYASLMPHGQWDRRAVITRVAHAAPALLTSLPAFAEQASKPSASISMDDLLESMATSQSKRTCTSAITCPSEEKKAAALQGSGRSGSKPPTKNIESSLQPSRGMATKK